MADTTTATLGAVVIAGLEPVVYPFSVTATLGTVAVAGARAGVNDGHAFGLAPGSSWPDNVLLLRQDKYGSGWEIGAYVYSATDTTKGAVVVAGYAATVTNPNQSNATKGAVTVATYAAEVDSADATNVTTGAVVVAGLNPTLYVPHSVHAMVRNIVITGLDASINPQSFLILLPR